MVVVVVVVAVIVVTAAAVVVVVAVILVEEESHTRTGVCIATVLNSTDLFLSADMHKRTFRSCIKSKV